MILKVEFVVENYGVMTDSCFDVVLNSDTQIPMVGDNVYDVHGQKFKVFERNFNYFTKVVKIKAKLEEF